MNLRYLKIKTQKKKFNKLKHKEYFIIDKVAEVYPGAYVSNPCSEIQLSIWNNVPIYPSSILSRLDLYNRQINSDILVIINRHIRVERSSSNIRLIIQEIINYFNNLKDNGIIQTFNIINNNGYIYMQWQFVNDTTTFVLNYQIN